MNCEYSDVIMLNDSNHQLRDEITELKKEIELLKTKLQRDDEILKDRAKLKDMFNPNHL